MGKSTTAIVCGAAILMLAAAPAARGGDVADKGVKVALNSATMTGTGAEPGLTPQAGLAAGAFVTLRLTPRSSIQPEILYTEKGAEFESGPNPYEYRLSYIEVPVLWKLTFASRGAAVRPHLYAGPFVGVNIGATIETYRDRHQEESAEATLASVRRIDAGIAAGAGVDVKLGPGRALLDVRYGRSLVTAFTTGADVTHSVISIFVGYSFD